MGQIFFDVDFSKSGLERAGGVYEVLVMVGAGCDGPVRQVDVSMEVPRLPAWVAGSAVCCARARLLECALGAHAAT